MYKKIVILCDMIYDVTFFPCLLIKKKIDDSFNSFCNNHQPVSLYIGLYLYMFFIKEDEVRSNLHVYFIIAMGFIHNNNWWESPL